MMDSSENLSLITLRLRAYHTFLEKAELIKTFPGRVTERFVVLLIRLKKHPTTKTNQAKHPGRIINAFTIFKIKDPYGNTPVV